MSKKIFSIAIMLILATIITGSLAACDVNSIISDAIADAMEQENGSESGNDSRARASATSTAEKEAYEITYQNAVSFASSIGTVWVQAIFEVTNTGDVPLYLSSGAYDLEDADGKLIASKTLVSVYPQVINPGEKAYYYDDTTLSELSSAIELTILPRPDVKRAKVDVIRMPITEVEFVEGLGSSSIKARGRVENTTDETQTMTYVAIVIFDESGTPFGVLFTILMEDLSAGDKIGFETSSRTLPPNFTLDSIADFQAFAYPRQWQF